MAALQIRADFAQGNGLPYTPAPNSSAILLAQLGREGLEALIAEAIDLLDVVDGDPDFEDYDVDEEEDDPSGMSDEDGVSMLNITPTAQDIEILDPSVYPVYGMDQSTIPLAVTRDAEEGLMRCHRDRVRRTRCDRIISRRGPWSSPSVAYRLRENA